MICLHKWTPMRRGFAGANDGSPLNGPEATLGRSLSRSTVLTLLELLSEPDPRGPRPRIGLSHSSPANSAAR